MQRVGEGIRCPICRDVLPITESGNDISKQMLSEIAAQAQAGQSDAQIYDYFRQRYGQRVLLRPPPNTAGWLLWGIPGLVLLLGGGALASYLRGPRRGLEATPASGAASPDDAEDPYLAELRAQVAAAQRRAAPPSGGKG